MTVVRLGNPAAVHLGQVLPGRRVTVACPLPEDLREAVQTIVADSTQGAQTDGVWRSHSADPAPAWVESDWPELAQALANHYGCPVGQPAGWDT